MNNRRQKDTGKAIVAAAWDLFCEHGYESITVDDILEAAHVSRGTFYHHFSGKDAVFVNMIYVFDDDYRVIADIIPADLNAYEKLLFIDYEFFARMENHIPVEMLSRVFSMQLITKAERMLLNRDRYYYRLCRRIIEEGQSDGTIRSDLTVNDIIKDFAMIERGMMYDWCLCEGEYSLAEYARRKMPLLLAGYRGRALL